MKFGLVGTGPWAQLAHGPGLAEADDVELVGVWGRSPDRTRRLAETLGTTAYDDYDAMLADVEAVAFAVPPDVQVEMAMAAVQAGRHLLLDKPVSTDPQSARALAAAAQDRGVSSVVFFTDRFVGASRDWLADVRHTGGWHGGWFRWFSALQEADNAFGASPWRQEHGALWDTGPHALSTLIAALGPVRSVSAVPGAGDLVNLTLVHVGGVLSTATLTQFAPPAAAEHTAAVWGESGTSRMPQRPASDHHLLLAAAAQELVAVAGGQARTEVDLAFGADVVDLLGEAQRQIDEATDATS